MAAVLGLFLGLLVSETPATAGGRTSGEITPGGSLPSRVAGAVVQFYQNVLSPVDGDRCRMQPTCSLYAIQAIRKHGVVVGVILAADRLMREGEEIYRGVPVHTPKGLRFPDPLGANDFWMGGSRKKIPAQGDSSVPAFVNMKQP